MKYTVPDYYKEFQCIAGACPATCCAGWQIVIDEKSLNKYRKCKTTFGNRLKNSVDWENGTFLQYDKRCAFLDEHNLCDMYTEAGPEMLCRTCRRYPRHIEEFQDERELSLSISCPVVARMILGRTSIVTFRSKQDDRQEKEDESFDFFLYSALQDARKTMIDILQDRTESVSFRMAKVLALAHDIQNRIDTRNLFETETLLERYQRSGANEKLKVKFEEYQNPTMAGKYELELLNLLDELEVLNEEWPQHLKLWREKLAEHVTCKSAEDGEGKSSISDKDFVCESAGQNQDWKETECEQLMVYFLYTYFCGAVYDGDALSKVKMAIVSTVIIQSLEQARQLEMENLLSLEDRACIAWSYSRELEHSDLNLNRMEEMMKKQEKADFRHLLVVCCSLSFKGR